MRLHYGSVGLLLEHVTMAMQLEHDSTLLGNIAHYVF